LKQDDDPWHLERLGAAEAPELWGALEAAKQQLPNAGDLAALAASLSAQGLPLPSQEGLAPALGATPRFRMRWPAIGAAVIGAAALSVKLAGPPIPASQTVAPPTSVVTTNHSTASVGAVAPSVPGSPIARANKSALVPTPLTPELPAAEPRADAPSPPLAASTPVPKAVIPSGPKPAGPVPEPAIPTARSLAGARVGPSPSTAAEGSSLEPGTKVRPSEIELLRDARLALRSSPTLALGLTEQHSALYPRGTMVQERELIAISALVQLGRHAAVLSRAQRFQHDFPSSPYRKQIAQMAE
jgi:hypothetical protein